MFTDKIQNCCAYTFIKPELSTIMYIFVKQLECHDAFLIVFDFNQCLIYEIGSPSEILDEKKKK